MNLNRGGWTKRNFEAIRRFMLETRPGLAVFDWDNTCICGDIGETFLAHLFVRHRHRLTRSDLEGMIPVRLRGISVLSAGGNRYEMAELRRRIIETPDQAEIPLLLLNQGLEETPGIGLSFAYRWATRLFKGLTRLDIDSLMAEILADELHAEIAPKRLETTDGKLVFTWKKGLRIYEEMRNLITVSAEAGWRTVIVTASHPWIVETMACRCGYRLDRVLGMVTKHRRGVLTRWTDRSLAVNYGPGKVTNIRRNFTEEPLLVAGDSNSDLAMLTRFPGTRIRLLIDRGVQGGIDRVRRAAMRRENGYLCQPVELKTGRFLPG